MVVDVGIDEVGRGSWAGPVVVAAAYGDQERAASILGCGSGYRDSKALSPKRRASALAELSASGVCFVIGEASASEIDGIGLTGALRSAALNALAGLRASRILLDGKHDYIREGPVTTLVGGDRLHPLIAAASIAAKVYRDDLMSRLDGELPWWDLAANKGYGSRRHLAALRAWGISTEHRLSFAPMRHVPGCSGTAFMIEGGR